jgi:hypothetical protein
MRDFKAVAEIIWKDMDIWEGWEGYQYGLKFVQISNEERNILEEVLTNQPLKKSYRTIASITK